MAASMLQFKTTLLLSWYEGVAEPHAIKNRRCYVFPLWPHEKLAFQGVCTTGSGAVINWIRRPACLHRSQMLDMPTTFKIFRDHRWTYTTPAWVALCLGIAPMTTVYKLTQWGAMRCVTMTTIYKLTLFKHVLPMNRFTIHMLPLSKQVTSLIHILPNSLWLLPLIREISHISGEKIYLKPAGELNAANLRWVLITFTNIQIFGIQQLYAVGCTCKIRYMRHPTDTAQWRHANSTENHLIGLHTRETKYVMLVYWNISYTGLLPCSTVPRSSPPLPLERCLDA